MVLLDTNALMDSRVYDVIDLGFLPEYGLTQSVLYEIDVLVHDSLQPDRQARAISARRYIDEHIIPVDDTPYDPTIETVDEHIIRVAELKGARICTADQELENKAETRGIKVLSIAKLAKALRPHLLPGQVVDIMPTAAGQKSGQAIGHTQDGTLIVIDQAAKLIGTMVKVVIKKSLMTDSGRMAFAKKAKS
jgi:uncharacterized protein YacL